MEVPLDRINPETLRTLITEFVTREWEELGDASCTLEDKINLKRLVPMHTEYGHLYKEYFANVLEVADGEVVIVQ